MASNGIDFGRPIGLDNFWSFWKGSAGVDNIINQNSFFASYIPNDITFFPLRVILSIIDDGNGCIEGFCQATRSFDTRVFWTDNNNIFTRKAFHCIVLSKERNRKEVIHWNIKEALNLNGVEVQGHHPTDTGLHQHIGNQLGCDGFAGCSSPVLSGITEIRHDNSDRIGAGPDTSINHDEQFPEVVVDGVTGWLDDVNIHTTDTFFNVDLNLSVRKLAGGHFSKRDTGCLGNFLCNGLVSS